MSSHYGRRRQDAKGGAAVGCPEQRRTDRHRILGESLDTLPKLCGIMAGNGSESYRVECALEAIFLCVPSITRNVLECVFQ